MFPVRFHGEKGEQSTCLHSAKGDDWLVVELCRKAAEQLNFQLPCHAVITRCA
jgi:hypothetical protein